MVDGLEVDSLIIESSANGVSYFEVFMTLLVLFLIMMLGFIKIRREYIQVGNNLEFSSSFLEKLVKYLESGGEDSVTYSWLVNRSQKLQRIMGTYGLMDYRPAFQNYYVRNHQIIINFIPELRRAFNSMFSGDQINFFADSIQESIVRYAGSLEDRQTFIQKDLKNPIQWINEGIGTILKVPLDILYTFKLLSYGTVNSIAGSTLFKLVKLLAFILGLVSAIMTIFIGWDNFLELISNRIWG